MTDPWARPANQVPPVPPPPQFPQGPPPGQGVPPQGAPGEPPKKDSSLLVKIKNLFRDPLSIVLVVVIVIALAAAGLLAGELYARSRADSVVARAAQCVVQDNAKASFGALPPFLMQHMSGHYTNIHFETAGNQIRQAKGMKVNMDIKDVRLEDTANSSGSIGSLVANITWTSAGHQGDHPERDPARRLVRHRRDDQPVRRHHRVAGRAGQHHRQAGGRRQRDLAAGDGIDRPRLHAAAGDRAAGAGRVHLDS